MSRDLDNEVQKWFQAGKKEEWLRDSRDTTKRFQFFYWLDTTSNVSIDKIKQYWSDGDPKIVLELVGLARQITSDKNNGLHKTLLNLNAYEDHVRKDRKYDMHYIIWTKNYGLDSQITLGEYLKNNLPVNKI